MGVCVQNLEHFEVSEIIKNVKSCKQMRMRKEKGNFFESNVIDDYYLVIDLVPITNKKTEITSWVRKWDRDSWSAEDFDCTKTTSCFMKSKRWEIEETPNLIFDLKCVCEVLPWRDWACGSINSILIRISPLLNTIPVQFTIRISIFCNYRSLK